MLATNSKRVVKIDYTPTAKQAEFHRSTADELLFGGAKSPGKSCALTMEGVAYALEYPKSQPHIFRETFDDLEANIIEEFKNRVPASLYRYDAIKHNAYMDNGSTIKFRYIKNLQDAKSYQGRSIPWIGIDEVTKHDEPTVQEILSCNRSAEGFPVRARFTSNPGGKGHQWVKKRFVAGTQYGRLPYIDPVTGNVIQFIPATVYDGVLVQNDPAYVRRLENLPESERKAYLEGDWDIFAGQFFAGYWGPHNICYPFVIPEQPDNSKIFGSLDHGTVHNTSFGLWWLGPRGQIYRIFTYSRNGGTTEMHAGNVVDAIESCRFSRYMPPIEVYYDYAMNKEHRLNEVEYRSDIDEYKDQFEAKGWNTTFVSANKRKIDGCSMMKSAFSVIEKDEPIFKCFSGLNDPLVQSIENVQTDALNTETYAKMDGDDEADECRYGIMGMISKTGTLKAVTKRDKPFKVPRKNKKIRQIRGLTR